MIQTALDLLSAFWFRLTAYVPSLIELVELAVVVSFVWLVVVSIVDRTRLRPTLLSLPLAARTVASWLGFAIAVAASVLLLNLVQLSTDERFVDMQEAQSSSGADPSAESTVQSTPRAVLITERTYRRTLSLPPDLLNRITAEGAAVLAPYLTDPSAENVTRLVDTFRRSGRRVIFERDATLVVEQPVKLDSSNVAVHLDFVDPTFGGRRTYFKAGFDATYVFHNSSDRESRMRFEFPLPTGSGTLSNVHVSIDGAALPVNDLSNGFRWVHVLPPGGRVEAHIGYQNIGARGWRYQLSERREPLSKLDLAVTSNRAPKFARYTLFPTQSSHSLGGSYVSTWHLDDVVTAQDVGLVFARLDVREVLAKMFIFAPIALGIVALFVAAFALRRGLPITPLRATMAILGFALGLALAGILTWYLPLIVGILLGCVIAIALAIRALGRAYVVPVALATLTVVAFLSLTNKSVLLACDMGAALLLLVPMDGLDFVKAFRNRRK